MTSANPNISEHGPAATGTVLDGHNNLGEGMSESETTMTDRDDLRTMSVIDVLDALERVVGTKCLADGIREFQDSDYARRRWAVDPDLRAQVDGYAKAMADDRGETFTPREEQEQLLAAHAATMQRRINAREARLADSS